MFSTYTDFMYCLCLLLSRRGGVVRYASFHSVVITRSALVVHLFVIHSVLLLLLLTDVLL